MIGVFDSGFGGLTILKELTKRLPEYDYVYFGDNARSPYGDKSQAVIYNYTKEAIDFLFKKGCQLVIIACNTASARALRKIQQEFLPNSWPEQRVLGVIIPTVEKAAEILKNDKKRRAKKLIGVVGTRSTIESGAYENEFKKINPDCRIIGQSCPLLVPLIEEGWIKKPETKMILKKYLRPLLQKQIDILILGCTHYPLLITQIKKYFGKKARIVNTPEAVGEKLENYLTRHPEIEKKLTKNKKRLFFTTDETDKFKAFSKKFLDIEAEIVERAVL